MPTPEPMPKPDWNSDWSSDCQRGCSRQFGFSPTIAATTLLLLACGERSSSQDHRDWIDERGRNSAGPRALAGDAAVIPLEGLDPARAQVKALMEKADTAIARAFPAARLSRISITAAAPGPTLDITKPDAFQMVYVADHIDQSKPPGRDVGSYTLVANARETCGETNGPCLLIEVHPVTPRALKMADGSGSRPLPVCDYASMWRAVLGSGVPSSVEANVMFDASDDPPRWSILVPGHSDLSRQADGTTCHVPKTGVCNCRPADPLCDCR